MRILVTFAVDWEFKPWRRLRRFERASFGERAFRSRSAETDVSVVLTGVGPEKVRQTPRSLLPQAPDLCIVSGLAGGLKAEHRPAAILAGRRIYSDSDPASFESDQGLFSLAVEGGAKSVEGVVSVSRLAETSSQKARLSNLGDAVDMESFAVMSEMSRLGVPAVVIRSVSDPVELDLPLDFRATLDTSGRVKVTRVFVQAMRVPRKAWPLARFGMSSLRAAEALAKYLEANIDRFSERGERLSSVAHQAAL